MTTKEAIKYLEKLGKKMSTQNLLIYLKRKILIGRKIGRDWDIEKPDLDNFSKVKITMGRPKIYKPREKL